MRRSTFLQGVLLAVAAIASAGFVDATRLPLGVFRTLTVGGGAVVMGTVGTRADLSELSTAWTTRVTRLGFAAQGDGPAVDYLASPSACTISGGDGGWQVPSADGKCWVAALPPRPDPRIWGAITGTNAATDTATMTKAVTALCARSPQGGTLSLDLLPRIKVADLTVPCNVPLAGTRTGPLSAGTTIDVSSSVAFGIRYQPPGWPAVRHDQLIFGPVVERLNFYSDGSNNGSNPRVLDFRGVNSGALRDVSFNGSFAHGVRLYGVYKFEVAGVTSNYYANVGASIAGTVYEVYGDLSGRDRDGNACSNGNCSTRTDIVTIRDTDHAGTGTGSMIWIHGSAHTTMLARISTNNKEIGLKVSCEPGFPDISYCPQFVNAVDVQMEGTVSTPFDLSDFGDFQCTACYGYSNGVSAANVVKARFQNYAQAGGAGGGLRWYGGRMVASGGSAFWADGITDIKIANAAIWGANLGNSGAAGVEIVSGSAIDIHGTTFCKFLGATPTAMGGIILGANTSRVSIKDNTFFGCTNWLASASTQPDTIGTRGNVGPAAGPTIGACGTSPSISRGVDTSFLLQVGTGNPSSCTVNFGNVVPAVAPRCVSFAAPGTGTVGSMATSVGSVTLFGPSSGGTYSVVCAWN